MSEGLVSSLSTHNLSHVSHFRGALLRDMLLLLRVLVLALRESIGMESRSASQVISMISLFMTAII